MPEGSYAAVWSAPASPGSSGSARASGLRLERHVFPFALAALSLALLRTRRERLFFDVLFSSLSGCLFFAQHIFDRRIFDSSIFDAHVFDIFTRFDYFIAVL